MKGSRNTKIIIIACLVVIFAGCHAKKGGIVPCPAFGQTSTHVIKKAL